MSLYAVAGARYFAAVKQFRRALISAFFLIAAVLYVASAKTGEGIHHALAGISLPLIVGVALAQAAGILLAAVRLQFLAGDFGHRLSFRDSLRATSVGALAGYFFFQMVGQIAARGRILDRTGVRANTVAILTLYERGVALMVSAALAVAGALYVFGSINIRLLSGELSLLTVIAGIVLATALVARLAWWDLVRTLVIPNLRPALIGRLFRIAAITLVIQGCTLVGYILAIDSVSSTASMSQIAAASCIVMFAASIPISFAGWGIREFSAVAVLGLVGIAPNAAITSSIAIGILSLIISAVIAYAMTVTHSSRHAIAGGRAPDAVAGRPGLSQDAALLVLPLSTALLLFFQIEVPVNGDMVNVSPADLFAAVCGVVVLLELLERPRSFLAPLPLYCCIASAAFGAAYLHGVWSFGTTTWATSKLIGWFVLLSYCGAGAMLANAASFGGIRRLVLTICVALAFIVPFTLIANLPSDLVNGLQGFAGNRNAFAFELVIAMAAGMTVIGDHPYWPTCATIFNAGVLFTGSHAGIYILAVVDGAYLIANPRLWRSVVLPLAVAVAFYLTAMIARALLLGTDLASAAAFQARDSSEIQHWFTIERGLSFFAAHPIVGNGLGYAYAHIVDTAGTPLVIHNVPLWIAAEFGIGGVLLAGAFAVHAARAIAARWPTATAQCMLLISLTFGGFGMVHDVFYQRSFWFLLGACYPLIESSLSSVRAATRPAASLSA